MIMSERAKICIDRVLPTELMRPQRTMRTKSGERAISPIKHQTFGMKKPSATTSFANTASTKSMGPNSTRTRLCSISFPHPGL